MWKKLKLFSTYLTAILWHFQLSGKSTHLLHKALLEMKPKYMATWCPTQISPLLSASKENTENIVPLSDVLATANIIWTIHFKSWISYHFRINIKYPDENDCTVEKLLKEFHSLWPTFNRNWCKFSEYASKECHKRFYDSILSNHFIQHPNFCSLIFSLFSIAPSVGSLKRVFSKLAKICYKDHKAMFSGTTETLLFLSVINIDVTNPEIDKIFQKTKDFLVNE